MEASSQQNTHFNLITDDEQKRGSGVINFDGSSLTIQASIKLPVIPGNESDTETTDPPEHSSAANNPNTNSEPSDSIPLAATASSPNASTDVESNTSSDKGLDVATATPSSKESKTGGSSELDTPTITDEQSPCPTSDSEPQEATETMGEEESNHASSDSFTQEAQSDSSDTATSDTETTDSSETESETLSEAPEELADTANNRFTPASIQSQEELQDWITALQQGKSQTPSGPITQIELVSWLQVPEILRALSNGGGPLRITYPDCRDQRITAEQQAIREFLVQGAGRELTALNGELKERISACHFVESDIVTADLAQAYLASRPLNNSSTTKLTVSEVIRTNQHFVPNRGNRSANMSRTATNGRDLILRAITTSMNKSSEFHTLIIEVPKNHCDVAKWAFATYYDKLVENKPAAQHAKVWVIPSAGSTKGIEESSFLDFIKDAPAMERKKKRQTAAKQTSTSQPEDQVLSN